MTTGRTYICETDKEVDEAMEEISKRCKGGNRIFHGKYEECVTIGSKDSFYQNRVVREFPDGINPLKVKGLKR